MPTETPILPGWALVDAGGGVRLAGWLREIKVAGCDFLELCTGPDDQVAIGSLPPERLQLINAKTVKRISPLDEQRARDMVRRQWSGTGR